MTLRFIRKKCAGLTLVEVMVAMFVFVILIAATSQIFAAAFSGYRDTKAVQQDLENAQFAMNKIAKELRTSTVVSPSAIGNASSVRFYDYSQSICFGYRINNNALEVAKGSVAAVDECTSGSLGSYVSVTTGNVAGRFFVTPSVATAGSEKVGRVTIELEINQGSTHTATIQTTVSLRDYGYVGLLNL